MKNGDTPAMPNESMPDHWPQSAERGLSKREHFAGLAMQGMIASTDAVERFSTDELTHSAVIFADKLLEALEK